MAYSGALSRQPALGPPIVVVMSLTQGLRSPRTPIRRFLDQEISAGTRRVRETYREMLPYSDVIWPGDGVGFEAGTVGTAIDQRLRLSFTASEPLDAATLLGVGALRLDAPAPVQRAARTWRVLADLGTQLVVDIAAVVGDLDLDARERPMTRLDDQEDQLARRLLCAAWFALNFRNPFAFPDTPMFQAVADAPRGFTLKQLLAVPSSDLVDDVLHQLRAAEASPLNDLRRHTTAAACLGGPTFAGSKDVSADADLIADGLLIDVKSTRRVSLFPKASALQLLGYLLLDYGDTYQIDEVGIYLSRAAALVTWPVELYLALLGTRRRELPELRAAFSELLGQVSWRADLDPLPDQIEDVEIVLADLACQVPEDCCRVCAQPMPPAARAAGRRMYCSQYCGRRAPTLRAHGWL